MKYVFIFLVLALVPAAIYADDSEKDLCKANDGKWKDGGCSFKEDDGIDKEQNEVEFEHELEARGMWDNSKEKEHDATLVFASEEEDHCEDNGGDWSKKDKECNNVDEDYAEEKHDYFANKPENRGFSDWEYPESDQ